MIQDHAKWKGMPLTKTWRVAGESNSFEPFFQVSALCVDDQGKILIVRHPTKNFWMLPGGTPHVNESPEDTLKREVMEEASCTVDGSELIGAIEMNFPNNPNTAEGEHFFQLRYFARVKSVKSLTPDPDHNVCLTREFVDTKDFFEYIPYDRNIHTQLLVLLENWIKAK